MDPSDSLTQLNQLEVLSQLDQALQRDLDTARKRRLWSKDWVLRRPQKNILYQEIEAEDQLKFKQAFRMCPLAFQKLLGVIEGDIRKQDTHLRKAITPTTRLQICLRFLASGANFSTLEDIFRVPHNTISKIVSETTQAIWTNLSQDYLKCPSTPSEWKDVVNGFWQDWQYPYCVGAVDGKHVNVQNFANSGSLFRNYKGTFSLVLFAICDSRYKFLYCNIGAAGSANDAAIWQSTAFKSLLEQGQLGLPDSPSPHVKFHLVGDDIFGLSETMMKPFPRKNLERKQLVFNYRLSRARRVIENAFGIMASRFRVLRAPLLLQRRNATSVVKACVVLHNFLLKESPNYLNSQDFALDDQGLPRLVSDQEGMGGLQQLEGNRTGGSLARKQRDALAHYFYNEGAIPWQWKIVFGEQS